VSLRLLLDEDLSGRVAEGLRVQGVDAVSVHELKRTGMTDEQQLALATAQARFLVTYNRTDFQILDAQWRMKGLTHAGILWGNERSIPRRAIGELIRALEFVAREHDSLEALCLPLVRPLAGPR